MVGLGRRPQPSIPPLQEISQTRPAYRRERKVSAPISKRRAQPTPVSARKFKMPRFSAAACDVSSPRRRRQLRRQRQREISCSDEVLLCQWQFGPAATIAEGRAQVAAAASPPYKWRVSQPVSICCMLSGCQMPTVCQRLSIGPQAQNIAAR